MSNDCITVYIPIDFQDDEVLRELQDNLQDLSNIAYDDKESYLQMMYP